MPLQRESLRKIYESQLGSKVRAYQWRQLKEQLINSKMPIDVANIRLAAKCKSVARRHRFSQKSLTLMIELAANLGTHALGSQIKEYAFDLNPDLTKDKFYYAFRKSGFRFNAESEYVIADLSEVLYRIFVTR